MNEIAYSDEFLKLKMEFDMLKERVANQIELHQHLVTVVGPNLKCHYMLEIGQFENRVYELKTSVSRWQRRFTLRQIALNRGENPNYAEIEVELDKEFQEYMEKIKQHIADLKEASALYHSVKFSDEETTAIRNAYLDAVKKLHPDLNPDLPQDAVDLWHQIQKAYEERDWGNVKFLAELVNDVVSGKAGFKDDANGIEELKRRIAALKDRSAEVSKRTADLRAHVPFTYEEFLDDEEEVKLRKSQLMTQIEQLESAIKEYEKLWRENLQ